VNAEAIQNSHPPKAKVRGSNPLGRAIIQARMSTGLNVLSTQSPGYKALRQIPASHCPQALRDVTIQGGS